MVPIFAALFWQNIFTFYYVIRCNTDALIWSKVSDVDNDYNFAVVVFLLANFVRWFDIVNVLTVQADAPLAIRPMLPYLTKSEIHAVMTGGFATIAGSVLAAYIIFGVSFLSAALCLLPRPSRDDVLWSPIVNSFPARSWMRLISCLSLLVELTFHQCWSPRVLKTMFLASRRLEDNMTRPWPWPWSSSPWPWLWPRESLSWVQTSGWHFTLDTRARLQ